MYDGSLSGILERFAPYREVRVETAEPRTAEELSGFGEIEEHDGRVARLLVRREVMTDSVQRMLATLSVTDLTVGEPAIDRIIAKLFAAGSVTPVAEPDPAAATTGAVT
jgi:ABC-2 type transport system ATP-binding protein